MSTIATPVARQRHYPPPVWGAFLLMRHLRDCRSYHRTGTTPYEARINIRRLFRLTNGRFNDAAARVHRLLHPPLSLPREPGVLGELDRNALRRVTSDMNREGLHVFSRRLAPDVCDRLIRFGRTTPCQVTTGREVHPEPITFDPAAIQGTRYLVDDQLLHEQRDVQRLAGDMSLLRVAQGYLGCRPVFTGCTMWWSAAYLDQPDDYAAQMFHFDMNQIKFLKVFIYLTDVTPENGPHVFVKGSHRRLPKALLEDRRYTDQEVLAHFPAERTVSLTGPTGTMFVEDTRGLHKGQPLQRGYRLCLQLQYATSGLGGADTMVTINDRFDRDFLEKLERYPRIYRHRFRRPA